MQSILNHDKSNLLETTSFLPDDALNSFNNASKISLPDSFKNFNNIIICGMGGSCISADILKNYLLEKSDIPIYVNRSSILPSFVNEKTLCIFISYSGNTHETLSCAKEALKKNSKCISITHGGELKELSLKNKKNFIIVELTAETKMPRSAVGELFYSLSGILSNIENLHISKQEIYKSIESLKEIRDKFNNTDNSLINLSNKIKDKHIVIFGVTPYTEAIALRWKTQFNENSKAIVIFNSFPELTHNEIVSLNEESLKNYYFLVLRDKNEDKFLKSQIDNTLNFFQDSAGIKTFSEEGDFLLERQMKLLYTGDYLSIFLALVKNVDPTPIETIMTLKNKMKDL